MFGEKEISLKNLLVQCLFLFQILNILKIFEYIYIYIYIYIYKGNSQTVHSHVVVKLPLLSKVL